MNYQHLNDDERYLIASLKKQRFSLRAIARELGRSPATISREIKRNTQRWTGKYIAFHACRNYRGRRSRSRKKTQFTQSDWSCVEALIRKDFSPEQVSGWLKVEHILSISHETIYRYIWRDRKNGGDLHIHLRGSQKQRRKRYGAYDSRGRLAGKTMISERPSSVNERRELGHWEVDTVHGKGKEGIVTIVERKTGYVEIGKLERRRIHETNARIKYLIKRAPENYKTITADNGAEFHGYRSIEKSCGVNFYFAYPYHSWERGTNENTNGLIRQYLPKGISMKDLTQKQCNAIANKLNNRPRKRYDYKTPRELYEELSNVALHG